MGRAVLNSDVERKRDARANPVRVRRGNLARERRSFVVLDRKAAKVVPCAALEQFKR